MTAMHYLTIPIGGLIATLWAIVLIEFFRKWRQDAIARREARQRFELDRMIATRELPFWPIDVRQVWKLNDAGVDLDLYVKIDETNVSEIRAALRGEVE